VILPKENRKDLRDVPRRVLKALRLVLVEHVDDVLREALVLPDSEAVFGPPKQTLEYRDGELWTPPEPSTKVLPAPAGEPTPATPAGLVGAPAGGDGIAR
jgi:ATP-dependent Lon protease